MKKIMLILIVVVWGCAIEAQNPNQPRHRELPPTALEVVSNLSNTQKKQLKELYKETRNTMQQLDGQLHALRDSIHTLMEMEGDNSVKLFPMLDREGRLQAELAKTTYRMRLSIDEILTEEQLTEFKKAMKEYRRRSRK